MSIGSILNQANGALRAHQTAIQVTGQNIANAETPGYTRQRARLDAAPPMLTPTGPMGTGVVVADVERLRDRMLDGGFRDAAGRAGHAGVRAELLGRVDAMFGEPSETGLASALDAFWSGWSELASNPGQPSARAAVVARGERVASLLGGYARQLDAVGQEAVERAGAGVAEANGLASRIADLNREIVRLEVGGRTAPDLRDARDLAMDQLSVLGPTRVIERADGSTAIYLEGRTLVDGADARPLRLQDGPPLSVSVGDGAPVSRLGGRLGALVEVANTEIPAVRAELDTIAAALVERVNTLHQRGWSAAGDAAGSADWSNPDPALRGSRVPFFEPGGTTASSLRVSAAVAADPSRVAAGTTRGDTADNRLALSLAGLRDAPGSVGGASFAEGYGATVNRLAERVAGARQDEQAHGAVQEQAELRRSAANGVSSDEELVLLMRHQQAYAAAAKLVTAADEMAQTILNMV